MGHEQNVTRHYEHGSLESAILDALKAAGKDPDNLSHGDLALVDEFHIGGRPATKDLGDQVELLPGSRCLDIGTDGKFCTKTDTCTGGTCAGMVITLSYTKWMPICRRSLQR